MKYHAPHNKRKGQSERDQIDHQQDHQEVNRMLSPPPQQPCMTHGAWRQPGRKQPALTLTLPIPPRRSASGLCDRPEKGEGHVDHGGPSHCQ